MSTAHAVEAPAALTIRERLHELRAPLRTFREAVDAKRARLNELAIQLLDADDKALRQERARIQEDLASVDVQMKHLATTEAKAVTEFLQRETARVDFAIRETIQESEVFAKQLAALGKALDECHLVSLPEPDRSAERERLRAQWAKVQPRYAELQRKLDRLKVDQCVLMHEKAAANLAKSRGLAWVV
jgi:septal ring factor EnvC (AmiA/AmiB activator)